MKRGFLTRFATHKMKGSLMESANVKVDDFQYVPSAWPSRAYDSHPADAGEFVNENIARIESLKIKLIDLAGLDEKEREALFLELDSLRSAFIDITSRQYR